MVLGRSDKVMAILFVAFDGPDAEQAIGMCYYALPQKAGRVNFNR